jgi:iron complex outermembrane receptor protein
MRRWIFWFCLCFTALPFYGQNGLMLRGKLVAAENNTPVYLANIYIHELESGQITDEHGNFLFKNLKPGNYHLHITQLGYEPRIIDVHLDRDIDLGKIEFKTSASELKSLEIEDSRFRTTKQEISQSIIVIDKQFIEKNPGSSFAGILSKVPGVQAVTTSTGIAKPLIRGLGFNRVAVAEYGLKQEGQQWGADHGLEIDQFNVERVEIIKGPGSLLYGSDAIGGIINIRPALTIKPDYMQAGILTTYRSNNNLIGYSAHASLQKKGILFKARFSGQDYGDYKVPADQFVYNSFILPIENRRLKNTAGRERNASLTLGLMKNWGFTMVTGTYYDLKAGFFPGAHGIPKVNDLGDDHNQRNIDLPSQRVQHLKVISNSNIKIGKHWLEADLGYQYNLRNEYSLPHTHGMAPMPQGNTELQFALQTLSGNIKFHHTISKRLKSVYGINGQYRDNKVGGYSFLIPNFNEFGIGAYGFVKYEIKPTQIFTAGIRYDYAQIKAQPFYQNIFVNGASQGLQRVSPNIDRNFGNVSGAIGFSWIPRERINIKVNLGSSYRLPTAVELTANGIHHGSLRHEKGDSTLTSERGIQFDFGVTWESKKLDFTVSPFFNYFLGFIFLDPSAEFSNLPEAGLLWKYNQADGIHTGTEFLLDYHPIKGLHLNTGAQFVYTYNLESGYNFPLIPPASGHAEIEYEYDLPGKVMGDSYIGAELRWAAPQLLVARNELTTPGYGILNLNVGTELKLFKQPVKLRFSVQNVLNTKYFNHLNNWRQLGLPEPGRNFMLSLIIPLEFKI